jgi:hypothetical protein
LELAVLETLAQPERMVVTRQSLNYKRLVVVAAVAVTEARQAMEVVAVAHRAVEGLEQ